MGQVKTRPPLRPGNAVSPGTGGALTAPPPKGGAVYICIRGSEQGQAEGTQERLSSPGSLKKPLTCFLGLGFVPPPKKNNQPTTPTPGSPPWPRRPAAPLGEEAVLGVGLAVLGLALGGGAVPDVEVIVSGASHGGHGRLAAPRGRGLACVRRAFRRVTSLGCKRRAGPPEVAGLRSCTRWPERSPARDRAVLLAPLEGGRAGARRAPRAGGSRYCAPPPRGASRRSPELGPQRRLRGSPGPPPLFARPPGMATVAAPRPELPGLASGGAAAAAHVSSGGWRWGEGRRAGGGASSRPAGGQQQREAGGGAQVPAGDAGREAGGPRRRVADGGGSSGRGARGGWA